MEKLDITRFAVINIEGRFIVLYPDLSGIFSLPQMLFEDDPTCR